MASLYQTITLADGALVGAPIPLPANLVGLDDATLARLGAAINPAPAGFAGRGLYRVLLTAPALDPATEVATAEVDPASRTVDTASATVTATYARRAADPGEIAAWRASLLAYAGTAHAALRDGGVTLPNGMRIKTDAESRGLIGGAYALSDVKPDATIDFKAATGWASIDAATMQTVAGAVGSWVQACYSAWRQVEARIAAGTITAPAQIDAAYAAVTLPG